MKKIIIANWKMNLTRQESLLLSQSLVDKITTGDLKKSQVILAPSFLHLPEVQSVLAGSKIATCGQNCSAHETGNYTGQTSVKQLKEFGVSSVILGHAEVRKNFDTNKIIKLKSEVVQKNGLLPIICIGENEDDKISGKTEEVLKKQIEESCPKNAFILAYEPLWAIGKKTATLSEVVAVCEFIKTITDAPILYGGSVKPYNAKDFLNLEILAGVLVGGASLKAKSFLEILRS
ncbi:MAG: hypothetical protein B6I23_03355, partial [Rickettsiaceae bacterium 4572_127]